MFEQLLHFSHQSDNMGIICPVQGGQYLVLQTNDRGEVIHKEDQAFLSLIQAKTWLKEHGIERISLRQSPVYFEMIGLPH